MNLQTAPLFVQSTPWHSLPAQEVLSALASHPDGLSHSEAERRLAIHGPNRLKPPLRRGPLARLALQLHNVLMYVLLAAALITALLGHWVDTAVILGVVVVNTLIGFIQEGKAERALEAIRKKLSLQATVFRNGKRLTIPRSGPRRLSVPAIGRQGAGRPAAGSSQRSAHQRGDPHWGIGTSR